MGFKESDFADRQKAVAEAKKALLEKFRARPGPDDPEVVKRQAEREAVLAARVAREAEREAARKAKEAELAEEAAREAERKAQAEQDAAVDAVEQAKRHIALLAEQKAARDARYAARKARR
jgi:hypothetical protein